MKNNWKKVMSAITVLLLVALVVPTMIPTQRNIAKAASNSKKPALCSTHDGAVREGMLMNVGNDVTLKLRGAKGKVSWKSDNKKVATVKKGKVVAVGKGECRIIATDSKSKKEYYCNVRVTNWLKANVSSIKMKVGETKTIKLKYNMTWGDVPYSLSCYETDDGNDNIDSFRFGDLKNVDDSGKSTVTLKIKAKKAGKTSVLVTTYVVYDDEDYVAYEKAGRSDEAFDKYAEDQEYIVIPVTITK